jgi:hypothetical protein
LLLLALDADSPRTVGVERSDELSRGRTVGWGARSELRRSAGAVETL